MINIYAPLNNLGYGVHASNIIKTCIENNIDINLVPIDQPQPNPYFDSYYKEALKGKFDIKNPSIFIFHDDHCNLACGSPLMTFSIFETTKLKPESLYMLEHSETKVVLVTTKEHKELLEKQISLPIEIIPEGVDENLFNTIPIDKYIDAKRFTYITVGKKETRKNTTQIIRSFMEKMKDKSVALIAHTFNPFIRRVPDNPFKDLACWTDANPLKYGFEYKGFNGRAHLFVNKECHLYFTIPTIPTASMPSLYHSANIGIQISRGEGWDLPLMEMLACGIPAIATDCLGHKAYLTDKIPHIQQTNIISSMGSETAVDNLWFKGDQGEWDILDVDAFETKLESTYIFQETFKDKSQELADFIGENFSWTKAVKVLSEVIDKYRN